jgi:hypothetical protein
VCPFPGMRWKKPISACIGRGCVSLVSWSNIAVGDGVRDDARAGPQPATRLAWTSASTAILCSDSPTPGTVARTWIGRCHAASHLYGVWLSRAATLDRCVGGWFSRSAYPCGMGTMRAGQRSRRAAAASAYLETAPRKSAAWRAAGHSDLACIYGGFGFRQSGSLLPTSAMYRWRRLSIQTYMTYRCEVSGKSSRMLAFESGGDRIWS